MRQKIQNTIVETDEVNGFNFRFEHDITGNEVNRLTCNVTPVSESGYAPGNAFFLRNADGTVNASFNQLAVDEDMAEHVNTEFAAIIAENTTEEVE